MKEIGAIIIVAGCLLLVVGVAFLLQPVSDLQEAADGHVARVVPASEPLAAGCADAVRVGDGACNLTVREYNALTMLGIWAGVALIAVAAIGFLFYVSAAFLTGGA